MLACDIALFWANQMNPHPTFGPEARIMTVPVGAQEQILRLTPAKPLGADLEAIRPAANVEQTAVVVHSLPAGLEMWIDVGDALYVRRLQPGDSFEETFCRTGYTPGTLPLAATGDIRIAMTTTGADAPADVKVKVLSSTTECPRQLLIVPGFDVGQLHLGMSLAEAGKAAELLKDLYTGPYPGTHTPVNFRTYSEGADAVVLAVFHHGQIAVLQIMDERRFITTTGIQTAQIIPAEPGVIPGSTEREFKGTEHGAVTSECKQFGGDGVDYPLQCDYQLPADRFTYNDAVHEECTPSQFDVYKCPWLGPAYYVSWIGVATKAGYKLVAVSPP